MTAVTNIFNKFKSSGIGSSISSGLSNLTGSFAGSASATRLAAAGLSKNGLSLPNKSSLLPQTSNNVSFNSSGDSAGPSGTDWRVRVSVNSKSGILYWAEGDSGIQAPLKNTDGVIFPYVPSLTVAYNAKYATQPLTHTNYQNYFYESSEVQSISLNADFSIQNTDEAAYFLAALYFFRSATKMFYGQSGAYQGSPPPIVYLDGYGAHYLPHVPCLITAFSHTMPSDVDYMEVKVQRPGETKVTNATASGSSSSGGVGIKLPSVARTSAGDSITTTQMNSFHNRVPTFSTFSLAFQPVYSRSRQREFDYGAFAKGDLITKGFL